MIGTIAAVTQLAGSVYKITVSIKRFVDAIAEVDRTISELQKEVLVMDGVLLVLRETLCDPILAKELSLPGTVAKWKAISGVVQSALDAASDTVQRLETSFDGSKHRSTRKRLIFLNQSNRQFKLNNAKTSIDVLRSQLHTHNMALQIGL